MGETLRIVRSGYTVLPNEIIRNDQLPLEAFGLLVKMLALPDEWNFSVVGLAKICHCGRDKIRSALNSIENAGYLLRDQEHGEDGRFCNTYVLYDVPSSHRVGFSDAGNPPRVTRQDKLNNNILNNNNPPKAPQVGRRTKEKAEWKPERFERLWEFYPHDKRGNRQKAIAAWDKLKPNNALIAEMGKSLELLLDTIWAEVGTPHVSTFLNGRRWEDAANVDTRSRSGTCGNVDGVTGWL